MSLCRCGNEQISDRLTLTAGTFVVTSGAVEHVTHLPGAFHLVSHTDQGFNWIGPKRIRYFEKLGHQAQFRHPVLDSPLRRPHAPHELRSVGGFCPSFGKLGVPTNEMLWFLVTGERVAHIQRTN